MENQDKNIEKYFRKLSEEQEPKSFQNMDKVWENIEQKLDKKETKKVIPFWRYASVAAALLVFVSLGIRFINTSNLPENPIDNEQRIVIDERKTKELLDEQMKSQEDVYAYEEVDNSEIEKPESQISERQTPIEGVITTEYGDPIPGVSVFLAGTNQGTSTDLEGNYSLNAKDGDRISFVFEGYKTTTLRVASNSNRLNATMVEDLSEFEEIVVDTYRTTTREESITGTYVVSSETIQGRPNPAFKTSQKDFTDEVHSGRANREADYAYAELKSDGMQTGGAQKSSEGQGTAGYSQSAGSYAGDYNHQIANFSSNTRYDSKRIPHNERERFYQSNSESYENFIENQFESANSNPVSTFSIDVDNASYTNIRRFINNGQTVPKDAVRIEEMVNFFKYDYAQPNRKHPFAIHTEYSDAPWNPKHKLLRIGLKGKEIPTDKLPKSNLVFLVDLSGSMNSQNKLPLLKSSLKVLLDELRPDDRVSIVYYANNVGVLLEPTKASEKQKIIEVIDKMNASGGTSGGGGIEFAYEMAEKHFIKDGNNRIILATDGDFNIGKSSDKEMQELIEEKRKSGVFLTCLGFGMGNYKDSKLMTLSKKGNGNYAYIDNIQEANRFLGKEFKGSMFAIAKDVKIQIEFNPAHVQAYRLVGYEMRKLRNEDFTNDAIDAGELGSGHTVTALYEVIPAGVESDFYSQPTELKYTQNTASGNFKDELATVKFRYKKPKEDKSIEMVHTVKNQPVNLPRASKDFKFASSVAWFGLKLRDSKLITNKESKDIINLAKEGLQNDEDGYKAEFIRLVESVR